MTGMLVAFAAQLPTTSWAKPAAALLDRAGFEPGGNSSTQTPMPGVLQCVPFARDTSGIQLYGDAHTWWDQAEGKYARGHAPRPGAVLAIQPHGNSTLGHVATVRRVIDARTILIDHANWSAPGKIERNVTVVDVSPANDWSEVRVWYAPIQNLGGGHWPVSGFIYNRKPGKAAKPMLAAKASLTPRPDGKTSTLTRFVPGKTKVRFGIDPQFVAPSDAREVATASARRKKAPVRVATRVRGRSDPIGTIIASAR